MKTIKKSLRALREEDHRNALYATLVFIMLLILFFLLVGFEQPDPPLVEKEVEIAMEDIPIEYGSQPKGGSQTSDMNPDPMTPTPQNIEEPAPEQDTQTESPVTTTSSTGSNQNSQSTQETNPPVDNTFTFNTGSGNGEGDGDGNDFGSGTGVGGNGQGNVPGDGTYNPNRKIVSPPNFDANAQEEGKIALDIYVDADGKVVKTKFKASKSTSGSDYLKRLAEKAARTMRYDKRPGAGMEYVGYQIFTFKKS